MPKTNSKKKAKTAVEETEKGASSPTATIPVKHKKKSCDKKYKDAARRLHQKFPWAEITVKKFGDKGGAIAFRVNSPTEAEVLRKALAKCNVVPKVTREYDVEIEWPDGATALAKFTVPVELAAK